MPSTDSSYAAVTGHQQPFLTSCKPLVLEIVDDDWVTDKLGDDDIEVGRHEPTLDEGELDADAIVVSPPGSVTNGAGDRGRREEGWNDLGLEQLDSNANNHSVAPSRLPAAPR